MPASTGENGEDTGNTESPSEFRPTLPVFRPTLLRPAEAAKALGISLAELDRMHRRGDGPAAIKIHRSRRYSQAEIEKWINPVAPLVSELLAAEYKPGWVYFLQAENRGRIKIGYAGNLSQRIGDIRGASPLRLELVGCFPGSFTEEAKLHKVFRRWRSHYEWFEPNAKLLALISEINSALTAA